MTYYRLSRVKYGTEKLYDNTILIGRFFLTLALGYVYIGLVDCKDSSNHMEFNVGR